MSTLIQDQYTDTRRNFRELFENYEAGLNGSREHTLHQLRRKALQRLDSLPFPTRRDEEWKYTPVTRLLQPGYADGPALSNPSVEVPQPPLTEGTRLVFVNGRLEEELSTRKELPEGVTLTTVEEAFAEERFRNHLQPFFEHWAKEENDPFIVLNAALSRKGIFIHIPRNMVVEAPLHLMYLSAPAGQPAAAHPQVFVWAEENSEFTLVESYEQGDESEEPYFHNVVNRMTLGKNARVKHLKLQHEGREGFQINNTEAYQERDSVYSHFGADLGGRLVRNNLNAIHRGEGIHTDYYGTYLADGRQHIDNHTFIDHALPNCTSNELYKGIIDDRGTGVFNGKVIVRQDAQKTNAFQQNSNLLLSDKATMDSKPQLEIYADDVKCSHGATIGQLDESAVFYLRTRGLRDADARRLLQHAFIGEVLENFPIEAIQEYLEALVAKKLV